MWSYGDEDTENDVKHTHMRALTHVSYRATRPVAACSRPVGLRACALGAFLPVISHAELT